MPISLNIIGTFTGTSDIAELVGYLYVLPLHDIGFDDFLL